MVLTFRSSSAPSSLMKSSPDRSMARNSVSVVAHSKNHKDFAGPSVVKAGRVTVRVIFSSVKSY